MRSTAGVWRAGSALVAGVLALTALGVVAPGASAQGVRYSITGTATQMDWDSDLGLANDRLFGLRAGVDFGPVVGLRAHYLWGNDFETELSSIDFDGFDDPLPNQGLDVKSIGGDLVVNVLRGSVIPYVTAGAGIMRFDPAESARFDQIYGRLGAGLGFELSRGLRGDVWVTNQRMRMDRFDLAPATDGGYPEDPQADDIRSNWTYNVGLGLDLGRTGTNTDGWSALSIPVEAFVGRLNYDGRRLEDQNLAGVRAGVDLRYVGLRGFYWRGINDDFNDTQRVQSFGGEVQFNLQAGNGLAPFLVLGGGNLDYRDGFEDSAGELPGDERFLIGGGGVALRLTDALTLNAAARDYIISSIDEEDVSQPDDLTHNWLFSAGVGVNIGRDRDAETIAQAPPAPQPTQPQRGEDRNRAQPDRQQPERMANNEGQTQQPTPVRDANGDRVIQIPVPERGEIYIRYGEGGRLEVRDQVRNGEPARTVVRTAGLTDAQLNDLADAVAEELDLPQSDGQPPVRRQRRSETQGVSDEQLRRIVREELDDLGLSARLEEMSELLRDVEDNQEENARTRPLPARGRTGADTLVVRDTVYVRNETAGEQDVDIAEVPADESDFGHLSDPVGYIAAALDEPSHMAFGARADIGRIHGLEAVAVVPEVALGFVNDGTSVLAAGNLEYRFGRLMIGDGFSIRPMVRGGVGFLTVPDTDTEGVLNLIYGFSSGIGDAASGGEGLSWFVEHQGIDLFNRSRIAAGLRWTR